MKKQNKILTKLKGHVNFLRDFLLDLLFPIECLQCNAPGAWLCKQCFRKLKFNDKPCCPHCYQENDLGEFCHNCKNKFFLNGIMIAGNYDNKTLANIIKTFKYRFNRKLGEYLGDYLSLFLKNTLNHHRFNIDDIITGLKINKLKKIKNIPLFMLNFQETIIIPVPLHKKRLNWRGFNQAEILANVITQNFNLTINVQNLKRLKHTIPQAKLKGEKRYKNLRNNFIWEGESLVKKNVLLIDDISTTGTTLNECAKTLKKAGAFEVWGLVVAKG